MPTYADTNRAINALLFARGDEIAGVPMPLPGMRLDVEDRHPARELIEKLQEAVDVDKREPSLRACRDEDLFDYQEVNRWYSAPERCWHVVCRVDGRPRIFRHNHDNGVKFRQQFDTLRASEAWSLEAEANALDRLETLIKPHLFEAYVLSGLFVETSRRSGLSYLFRKLRPTIALSPRGAEGGMKILAALCLHPVAYYAGTFAGGLCPTDDVISHLLLMRGDEALYWRRANQHQPDRPEAGL